MGGRPNRVQGLFLALCLGITLVVGVKPKILVPSKASKHLPAVLPLQPLKNKLASKKASECAVTKNQLEVHLGNFWQVPPVVHFL